MKSYTNDNDGKVDHNDEVVRMIKKIMVVRMTMRIMVARMKILVLEGMTSSMKMMIRTGGLQFRPLDSRVTEWQLTSG